MKERLKALWQDNPLLLLIGLGLLLLPVTNAVGQVPLYLASVLWMVQALTRKSPVYVPAWIAFGGWMLLIGVGFLWAVHPELGLDKLNRFLIFPLTGAVTAACLKKDDPLQGVRFLCLSLIAGVAILGIHDLVEFPLRMRAGESFVDVGNMTSPQFYMVGIMLWLGLMAGTSPRTHLGFWLCLPLLGTGVLLHQKRGVWLACAAAVILWTLWTRRWNVLISLALLGAVSLTFPFVQTRIQQLSEVMQPTHGGRMILWREVAPRMFEAYPRGMGYNGSRYEDFREHLPPKFHMEEGLRHLHNNFLQIRLELGWPGLGFWSLWMGWILFRAFANARSSGSGVMVAVAFGLLALHLNGMVEYNFGDSEVLKVFLFLFGCVDVASLNKSQT